MQDERIISGSIPVIQVEGKSLAEAWEKSLLALYQRGCRVRTEYDRTDSEGQPVDPPSLDSTMIFAVLDPSSEPMIHRAFPGGLEDLEEYRQEVLKGIKDHWVRDPSDPEDNRWEYTYHERIFSYRTPGAETPVDQIDRLVEKLVQAPQSRRCQAITWKPWEDLDCYDPPCLQSLWFRILPNEAGEWVLNMNIRFRSRDAYDAAYMNAFALVHLQEMVAKKVSERANRPVHLGRYVDISDSYHIYGRRLQHFEEGFLKLVKTRSFEERTWTREFAEPIFEEARPLIQEKVKKMSR